MSQNKNALAVVISDNTFEKVEYRGNLIWQGKCIFCNKKLSVKLDGTLIKPATIEHILPKAQGGTNSDWNLAIACRRCNGEKGVRHDSKKNSKRSKEVIDKLLRKRLARYSRKEGIII